MQDLKCLLDPIFADPRMANAFWGVRVEPVGGGEVLYDLNGRRRMTPASNMKVFTTAAALHYLGSDFRYSTRILADGVIEGGVLRGNLVIEGEGDPTTGSPRLPEGQQSPQFLFQLVSAVREAGIREVRGAVLASNGRFPSDPYSGAWEYIDLRTNEATFPSSLSIDENGFRFRILPGAAPGEPARIIVTPESSYFEIVNEVRTGVAGCSTTARVVHRNPESNRITFGGEIAAGHDGVEDFCHLWDGPGFVAHRLVEALREAGIEVQCGAKSGLSAKSNPAGASGEATLLHEHKSPPLPEIVRLCNKPSNNFIADMLLCRIGLEEHQEASFEAGARSVSAWLQRLGVPDLDSFSMHDGSGLARRDAVTPEQLCAVLRAIWQKEPYRDIFYDSLPIAGHPPDLGGRMQEPPLRNNVHAKTGLLSGVRALSGYVTEKSGRMLVFSMMANNYTIPWPEVDGFIDRALWEIWNGGDRGSGIVDQT